MIPRTILCVENQPHRMAALRSMLERFGYEVMPATNGGQALDVMRRQKIHGALVEYDLHDTTGVTLRAELKRLQPEVPVLLFAGVGTQTPVMLRFFDLYLRSGGRLEDFSRDLEA